MNTSIKLFIIVAASAAFGIPAAQAGAVEQGGGQVWITNGFLSHHINRSPRLNENNTGLGLQYTLSEDSAIAIGQYKNSFDKSSHYAQFVYTPFQAGPFKVGGAFGVIDGYHYLNNGRVAPALMPVATASFKVFEQDVGLSFMFIPTVSRDGAGALAVQFKVRLY